MPKLKTAEDIQKLRLAGRLAAQTLQHAGQHVKPGVTTEELDQRVYQFITAHGATPSPLGYRGYPKSICTSINDVVCHGIPSVNAVLKEGDLINIDVTVTLNGYFGDCSRTYLVGENISPARKELTDVTAECLARAIAILTHGARLGDIGHAIQSYAESHGYGVVRDFVGHGIGKIFHEPDLQIPHFGRPGTGLKLVRGLVFTIEPMINAGDWRTQVMSDGWTAKTVDGKDSAQFEHTLALVGEGVEILTALEDDPIAIRAQQLGARVLWPTLNSSP